MSLENMEGLGESFLMSFRRMGVLMRRHAESLRGLKTLACCIFLSSVFLGSRLRSLVSRGVVALGEVVALASVRRSSFG